MQAGEDSGSFWEPGNYRRITQRVSEGQRLCKDMVALLMQRAAVEKAYAKELHAWAKRGRELLQGGPQYGTTDALCKAILTEGEKLGDLHQQMEDKLSNDVIKQVKTWTKDSYHKSKSQIKKKKEMEEAFKTAQKPWEKLYRKVEAAKMDYHTAFATERSAFSLLRNAYGDPDLSLSQVKKIKNHSVQCRDNLNKAKEMYEASLRDLHLYNSKYIDDMTAVFEKSQDMERERLQFFKEIMFSAKKCLDLSQNFKFHEIYEEFYAAVDNADPEKELKWWSQNDGPRMDMKWPTFEEYQEEWKKILKRKSNKEVAPGTTLTNWRAVGEYLYECNLGSEMSSGDEANSRGKRSAEAEKKIVTNTSATETGMRGSTNPFDEDESDNETGESFFDCGAENKVETNTSATETGMGGSTNPFDEDESDN